jgi:hypothetical protein
MGEKKGEPSHDFGLTAIRGVCKPDDCIDLGQRAETQNFRA